MTLIALILTIFLFLSSGVGIDAGNGKDWESNAKSIQLIKQRGKVKALDEEIHSKLRGSCSHDKIQSWGLDWSSCKLCYSWDT